MWAEAEQRESLAEEDEVDRGMGEGWMDRNEWIDQRGWGLVDRGMVEVEWIG